MHYEHTEIGYNYRMSNLLAALGRAQLDAARRDDRAPARLAPPLPRAVRRSAGVTVFGGADGVDRPRASHDNFWLTSVLVDPETAGWSAEDLRLHLAADDIEARPLWKPMHLQPVFAGRPAYSTARASGSSATGLSLPERVGARATTRSSA